MLIVIDGFGCRKEREFNAIAEAASPVFERLFRQSAWTTLEASGLAVGLPAGQMGNSEVGHLNLGAGRVVDQDIVRMSKAVNAHQLAANPILQEAVRKRVHLVGLLSDGGVHSHQDHLHGLIDAVIERGASEVFVHAILDGRDTPPRSAETYLGRLLEHIRERPQARLATMIGRYFIMDRDQRWERVQRGYDLLTLGVGTQTRNPLGTLRRAYEQGVSDEFLEPVSVLAEESSRNARIEDGDTLIFFNFRADRMRQIVTAFKDDDFRSFARSVHPHATLVTMNRYREDWMLPVLFPPVEIHDHLGEVLSQAGLRQLRIAETEKYAHVTFFFNGGSDSASPGESRILIPSPKVATYDLQPEMSLPALAERVAAEIASRAYDVIIMNIANPDMVGHTGVMDAAVEAVRDTGEAIAKILAAVERIDGVALITADHGNCELMFDTVTNQPHTAHTSNPVPLILVDAKRRFGMLRDGGTLANVAPTMLAILHIAQPAAMTGTSLLAPLPARSPS